jgi:hypothetical protein
MQIEGLPNSWITARCLLSSDNAWLVRVTITYPNREVETKDFTYPDGEFRIRDFTKDYG